MQPRGLDEEIHTQKPDRPYGHEGHELGELVGRYCERQQPQMIRGEQPDVEDPKDVEREDPKDIEGSQWRSLSLFSSAS